MPSKSNKGRSPIKDVERKLCFMRCFEECLNAFTVSRVLPKPICYEPAKTIFKLDYNSYITDDMALCLFQEPIDNYKLYESKIDELKKHENCIIDWRSVIDITTNSEIEINSLGHWIKITNATIKKDNDSILIDFDKPRWLLRFTNDPQISCFKLSELDNENFKLKSSLRWLLYVENIYSLTKDDESFSDKSCLPNHELMNELAKVPDDWKLENDEELADFLKDHLNIDLPGCVKNIVKMISLSTQRTPDDVEYLMSLDKKTYWESDTYLDAYNSNNAIKINFKPNVLIRQLFINVDKEDRRLMPKNVAIMGGDNSDELFELRQITINPTEDGDILVLENCSKAYNFIEIKIKSSHKNGNNCRVRYIKAFTSKDDESYLTNHVFNPKLLHQNFLKIGSFSSKFLYQRSKLLLRFVNLFDLCIETMLPSWSLGKRFEQSIQAVKQLLILSKKRLYLIDKILRRIPTSDCPHISIYINRQLASQYYENPTVYADFQNTVFMQIYKTLKTVQNTYNFRWNKDVEQWWECKFIGEGIIDQGGGFRDSLSDISEELCPNNSQNSKPIPLPFFIRSPNQNQSDLSTFKDTYIINPSCHEYEIYEFIGKLMGACLRSRESLVLYLAPYVWKKISGEVISWNRDYVSVDAAEVKILDIIAKIGEEDYNIKFAKEKTWTCILSDGTNYELKPNGNDEYVKYQDRLEYIELVKKARIHESDKQLNALKNGLESVVSRHILSLHTGFELEKKICGSPEISIEDLKMSIEYDDLHPTSNRVKFFWEAMNNFTDDERSKFVRFVTGRKRLPVKILFCPSDQPVTSFPDSSTCNCTLFFPNYTSAKMAEEKLKYAIYNCVAIDTDISSYDED